MLETIARIAAPLAVSYLVGGIPFSLIIGKTVYGVDPREHGSGNLGATNVYRTLGWKAGLVVALLDIAKGAASVVLAMLVVPDNVSPETRDWILVSVAIVAILGHTYSPYIRFKGGKGVATAAGVIAVMMPLTWPIMFVTFVVVLALWRMVSLASVILAVEFPLLVALLYPDRPAFLAFALAGSALVIFRHRSNISRIARRQEPKISWSRHGTAARDSDKE